MSAGGGDRAAGRDWIDWLGVYCQWCGCKIYVTKAGQWCGCKDSPR